MATSPPDGSEVELATPDLPHPSPAPDASQEEVTLASLSYDLLGLSLSIDPEPLPQPLERFLSSIEDDDHQASEHAAWVRRTTDRHLRTILSRPQVENGLGTISELLENSGDSPVYGSETIKDPNPGESSKTSSTSNFTVNGFSGRTGPRHRNVFPHSWDQVSVTSLQTFETALSSIGSYATAPSGPRAVSHFGQWTASNTEKWLAQDNPWLWDTQSWHPSESLVRSIESIYGRFPANVRAAVRNKLLPICDPALGSSTLVKSSSAGLVSRIEQICSSYNVTLDRKNFTGKAERIIMEHLQNVTRQLHLQSVIKDTLPIYEPFGSQWLKLLKAHNLILDPREALDWSGRGQHVEYSLEEQEHIPLVAKGNLGFGASGIVDRVRCRRIDLARKTIRCIRKPTREEAVKEVRHLQQLQHRHIVRLVGTYMLKKNLSILMYPATQYSLDGFLDVAYDDLISSQVSSDSRYWWCMRLLQLIACLVNAVAFIHSRNTKHMDIKPNNILVNYSAYGIAVQVYITDFGIARSYQTAEESFTDSPISCTRIYTAPEVAHQTTRGPPADIFSLGCVFMEILATLLSTEGNCQQERLRQVRNSGTDNSYQANVENVFRWYESQKSSAAARWLRKSLTEWYRTEWYHLGDDPGAKLEYLLPMMLSVSPERRPSAAELKEHAQYFACGSCDHGPEPFEAAT